MNKLHPHDLHVWQSPVLVDLSTARTQSGEPASTETITTIDSVSVGPTATPVGS